jgi:hypothetical protein
MYGVVNLRGYANNDYVTAANAGAALGIHRSTTASS